MSQRPSVSLIGNVTNDPDVRFSNSGSAVTTFGVAVTRRERKDNQWVDGETEFFDVVCLRSLAENVAETVSKGTRVVVVGELQQRKWMTESGERRSKLEVLAEAIGPDLRFATAVVTKNGGNGSKQARSELRSVPEEEPF